jgi:Tol biopolymer transport system component
LKLLDLGTGEVLTVFDCDVSGLLTSETLSDGGNMVSFALETRELEKNREVYVIDLERKTIFNVSQAKGNDDFPRLSPSGRCVLFTSKRRQVNDVFLADLDAHTLTNLTQAPDDDRLSETPGDKAVVLYRDWGRQAFYTLDLATGKKTPIPDTRGVWTAELSADGRRAVLVKWRVRTPYLCVVDL